MERQKLSKVQRSGKRANDPLNVKRSKNTSTPAHPIHTLQRAVGNRAVQRLLQSPRIQAKLKVSEPGDKYEQEADRTAESVMRAPQQDGPVPTPLSISSVAGVSAQRAEDEACPSVQCAARSPLLQHLQPNEEFEESRSPLRHHPQPNEDFEESRSPLRQQSQQEDDLLQTKQKSGQTTATTPKVESQINKMQSGGGEPLSDSVRAYFEPRLGQDLSEVRVHRDSQAAESARAINARAYTIGRDIAFGAGEYAPETTEGKRILAHELAHVAQQESRSQHVQRYESGEHAQLGETQAELTAVFAPTSYLVLKGDRPSAIAKKFGITVAELKEANKSKLKKWPVNDGSGRLVEGFNAGETVSIPQKLNDFAKAAIKDKSATFTVNGVALDYGVGIAMGDLFESPEQMAKASPEELKELAALIKREQTGGKVTAEEWQKATRGRYLKLAEKNVAHFAPQNASLVKPSAVGAASVNHKSEWEKHHAAALEASRAGDKDKALMINAFGDHFLTDAFAAGHLINKFDVMEQFKSQLKLDAKGKDFTADSKQFFDDVAKAAFTGAVQTEFSKYETVESKGGVFRPNIDSVSRFSLLLQGIHMERPDILANAVAKGVHDRLNTFPGGLPVENAKGDPPWKLSGDGTLNADTSNVAHKAVAQSQLNVISVYNLVGPLDTLSLFKRVWDYTPRPSATGITQLVDEVKKGTDINSPDLKKAIVNLIQANYMLIIEELVKLNKLKKA